MLWSRIRTASLYLLISLLPVLLAACATNPVTGKKELSFLSLDDEERMGAESDQSIVAQYGVVNNPRLASYVTNIGNELAPVSHMPQEDFVFRVLDDPVVNAFALPGGYIYVTRGILAYINDEAALAGIMGHEIGHVTARHSAQQYTQQVLLGLGTSTVAQVFKNVPMVGEIAGTGATLLLLKYSRDDERQSDRLGVEYATKIGYDTVPMGEFFHTLDALSGGQQLPGWASTHPDPGDRYDTVRQLTTEWQARVGGSGFQTNRNGYLEYLEGLVYGQNPRQGFAHDDEFVHPDLAFRFPIPRGWKLFNSAAAVQIAEASGKAVILFELAPNQTDPAAAATAFVRDNRLSEFNRSRLSIAGDRAVEIQASATSQQGTLILQSTFITRDGLVYAFHGLADERNFAKYQNNFTQSAHGFASLTDPNLLNAQPVLLHVVMADRSASFREQLRRYPIPPESETNLAGLALLNGFGVDEVVPKGTFLKVLVKATP